MVELGLKSIVYQKLQPMAQAIGMTLAVLDKRSYKSWDNSLQKKMASLGIEASQWHKLDDAIDTYGYAAILKSNAYYGPSEVAAAFAAVSLDEDDVHMLNSINAKNSNAWGDLDASIPESKRMFFYWFAVEVVAEDGIQLSEDDRYSSVEPAEWHGIRALLTVADVLKAMDKASYQYGYLNVGFSGRILGQVNKVFASSQADGTHCIMQLAPYKNGSRSIDCSVGNDKMEPLRFPAIREELAKMKPTTVVLVRYKNVFGADSGKAVDSFIDRIDVDQRMGVFLRLSTEYKLRDAN